MLVDEGGQVSQTVPVQVDLVLCGQHDLLLGPVLVPGQPDHFDFQTDIFLNLCCEFVLQELLKAGSLFTGIQDGDLAGFVLAVSGRLVAFGSRLLVISSGLLFTAAAGSQGQNHDQSQKQSKDTLERVLHFVSSLICWLYNLYPFRGD